MTKLAAVALCLVGFLAQSTQRPPFRSATELISVDVQVSDRRWNPVTDLRLEDFEVRIDGKPRIVASSQLVNVAATSEVTERSGVPAMVAQAKAEATTEGRTFILAIDQSSLQVVNEPAALEVVSRFLTLTQSTDRVGLVAYPQPGLNVAPSIDREAVRAAARRLAGQYFPATTGYNISLSEAVDFAANDSDTIMRVSRRECRVADITCVMQVSDAAREIARTAEVQALRSISGLKSVVDAVRDWPGRKTLVVVSAGMATSDRIGARPDIRLEADILGRRAAEANAVIYTLHLDVAFLTQFSAKNRGRVQTVFRDGGLAATGLERFTGNAGGSLLAIHAGPDQALNRLLRETSYYYLLGVEAIPVERDGKTHRIEVRIRRPGTTVRARSRVLIPKAQ